MWNSAFGVDDPINQYTADLYGIVMGTSHQEPMARASPRKTLCGLCVANTKDDYIAEWSKFGSGPWNWDQNTANLTVRALVTLCDMN